MSIKKTSAEWRGVIKQLNSRQQWLSSVFLYLLQLHDRIDKEGWIWRGDLIMEAKLEYSGDYIAIRNFHHYVDDEENGNPYNCSFDIIVK